MPPTVCFDALGTCFSFEPLIEAMESVLGKELRDAGQGARMVVMDWIHAAQRDYTYLSIVSAPPPPISQILILTLPRSLTYALSGALTSGANGAALPDLAPITSLLASLSPSPTLEKCFSLLHDAGGKVVIVTNGSQATTQGYVDQAGVGGLVDAVLSCDEVGEAKPFKAVYEAALRVCERGDDGDKGERWFVAAHGWDVAAARKAGFKTGLVLAEQVPRGKMKDGEDQEGVYWAMLGGIPDVVGNTLEEVAKQVVEKSA